MSKNEFTKRTESGTHIKAIIWHPSAKAELRAFPEEIRVKIGYLLHRLQTGETLSMPHSRSMSSIGIGAHEIRVRAREGVFRFFYVLKIKDCIYALRGFQKKTEKTPQEEIKIAQKRLKELWSHK